MTPALAGVFYLVVLLIVAGAAVYLFRTRPKEVSYPTGRTSDGDSAGDLEKYISATGFLGNRLLSRDRAGKHPGHITSYERRFWD